MPEVEFYIGKKKYTAPEGTTPEQIKAFVKAKTDPTRAIKPESTIRALTAKDIFREGGKLKIPLYPDIRVPGIGSMTRDIGRTVGEIGGALAGSLVSPIAGTGGGYLAGGTLADILMQQLQKAAPGYFGQVEDQGEGITSALTQTLLEGGIDVGTAGITKTLPKTPALVRGLKARAKSPLGSEQLSKADIEAVARVKEPTALDVAPKRFGTITGLFNEKEVIEQADKAMRKGVVQIKRAAQGATIRGKQAPLNVKAIDKAKRSEAVFGVYSQNYSNIKRLENQAWQAAQGEITKNTDTFMTPSTVKKVDSGLLDEAGQPIVSDKVIPGEAVTIEGPIYTTESSEIARELLPQIAEISEDLPDWLVAKKNKIRTTLQTLAEPLEKNGQKVDVGNYAPLKELRDDINRMNDDVTFIAREEGRLAKLAQALDSDIKRSIANMPNAIQAFEEARKATKARVAMFPKDFRNLAEAEAFAGSPRKLKPELMDRVANDAGVARQFIKATGDYGRKHAGAYYIDKKMRDLLFAGTPESMGSKVKIFLKEIEANPNTPAFELLGPKVVSDLKQLARGMELTHDVRSHLFQSSVMNWRRGYIALGIAGSVTTGALKDIPAGMALMGLTFAPRPILSKYVLDPKFRKLVNRATKVDHNSPEGKWTSKQLRASLAGMRGILMSDKGDHYVVMTGGKGKGYKVITKEEYEEWAVENE